MADTPLSCISRRALIGAGLAAAPATVFAQHAPIVTMLGDSITAGYGLAARDALPNQLQAALEKLGVHATVRGAGISGDTTADGAGRLDFSVRADSAVVIVALGGNDLLRGLDPKATYANLDSIVCRLKARGAGVILAGMHAPPEMGRGYAKDYDAVFPAVAKAHNVTLYPDLLAGVGRDPALHQPDAIHPNAKGAGIIAARLAPVVKRLLADKG